MKCWLSGLEYIKCLSERQTGKNLIRLLLQKKSDLGQRCLSRPFWQATSVQNLRTFSVITIIGGKHHDRVSVVFYFL